MGIYNIWYGISAFCLSAFFQSFFWAKLGHLLIIGPSGFYYRKILSSGVFSWNQVTNVKEDLIQDIGIVGGMVTISISLERTIKLRSNYYLNKEFPKRVEIEMFFTLFYIYSHRGEIPSHIQEMNKQLLSSLPISEISQLKTKDVHATQSNVDKREEESKISDENQLQKFPPISELLKKLSTTKKEQD